MIAVDTNIFVYSISSNEPVLQPAASGLITGLDPSTTVLLGQVACEFGAVTSRLSKQGRVAGDAGTLMAMLRRLFPLVLPSPAVLDLAVEIGRDYQVSYWDSMLLAACVDAGVKRLYTQDLQSAAFIRGVEVVNPLPAC